MRADIAGGAAVAGRSLPMGKGGEKWPIFGARSLRDQCEAARVPFFFKQWGEHAPNGSGRYSMIKVGKKAAGRLLDGREHNAMPEVRR
jgi:protein gp37